MSVRESARAQAVDAISLNIIAHGEQQTSEIVTGWLLANVACLATLLGNRRAYYQLQQLADRIASDLLDEVNRPADEGDNG